MTNLEFEQALDRWGTDLDRWPASEAERGRACLAADEGARRLLEAARGVDAFLEGWRTHAPPAYLAARIRGRATAGDLGAPDALETLLGWFTARLWRPVLFATVVTTAGYITGLAVTGPDVDPVLAEDVMTLAFSDIYGELEDAQQ